MKKFVTKVLLFTLILGVISIAFSYAIDPFNVFHSLNIKDNGVEPNKNYIKMNYILNNPDKFDSFVFGSSRVGNIHVNNIWGQTAYNMTYSEGTPKEALENVKTLIKNDIYPKNIYLGVDSLSYTIDPDSHNSASNAPYELSINNPLKFYSLYIDPAMSLESYLNIISKHEFDDSYAYRFYEFGWNSDYGQEASKYDFENVEPSIGNSYRLEETINEIKELKELCDSNNIKLTVFTNPMHYVTYEASLDLNYFEFLRQLAEVTEFCNFSGYNDITTDNSYWIDNSHYNAEVSDMVLECTCFHAYYPYLYEQGFGQWVNSDNIESFINLLIETAEAYKK
ncbi:MAG: hypothetical protein Q4B60_00510 [Erysipelotrichaceae bacterium]|nr:hypothetical protein [Erysipelotrichaceae bacterium]